ncbi:MAG: adenylate kinase [Synergistaceae bacterium]|jgi:adenylate kinase|nr:adenylate kinase [Synergistaceae bacterium]
MRIILIGPPGAGKGTQAAAVKSRFPVDHISTGDILRENVRAGSPLGIEAKKFMDSGTLVPDALIIEMMRERLAKNSADGFMLDGFPRTVAQAEALDELTKEMSMPLDAAILLEVPDETVVKRLCGRRVCSSCGAIFHVTGNPTAVEGICDVCSEPVVQRDDDREEVIRRRLSVYHRDTAPLAEYYEKSGLLRRVDASGPFDAVKSRLESAGLS